MVGSFLTLILVLIPGIGSRMGGLPAVSIGGAMQNWLWKLQQKMWTEAGLFWKDRQSRTRRCILATNTSSISITKDCLWTKRCRYWW